MAGPYRCFGMDMAGANAGVETEYTALGAALLVLGGIGSRVVFELEWQSTSRANERGGRVRT
jgi:hypothetical protein